MVEIIILIGIIWGIFTGIILPIKIYNTCKKIDEYLPQLSQKMAFKTKTTYKLKESNKETFTKRK